MNILEQFPMKEYGWGNVRTFRHPLRSPGRSARPTAATPAAARVEDAGHRHRQQGLRQGVAKLISLDKSPRRGQPAAPLDPHPYESPDTTHFSIADKDGNVVTNTYTLSSSFGAHVVVPGTGFLLNNSMGNYDWGGRSQSLGNRPEPGKRAQSDHPRPSWSSRTASRGSPPARPAGAPSSRPWSRCW